MLLEELLAEQERLTKIAELIPLRLFPEQNIHVSFGEFLADTMALLIVEGTNVFAALSKDLINGKESRLLQLIFEAFERNAFPYPLTPTRQDFYDMIEFWGLPELMLRGMAILMLLGHADPTVGVN